MDRAVPGKGAANRPKHTIQLVHKVALSINFGVVGKGEPWTSGQGWLMEIPIIKK